MESRKILYATEGKILTDGEIYGTKIYLAEGRNAEEFYEISTEDYSKILQAQEEIATIDEQRL
jgi:hypothetical protein